VSDDVQGFVDFLVGDDQSWSESDGHLVGSFCQHTVFEEEFSENVTVDTVAFFEFQTLEKTSSSNFIDQWTF